MYVERPTVLPGTVAWTTVVEPGGGGLRRVLPDGCLDLIWWDGGLVVAGPDTAAHVVEVFPGDVHVGIRFGPGVGPAALGVPADELRDQRIPLDALWPAGEVRRLEEFVGLDARRDAALESVAATKLRPIERIDPMVLWIADRLRAGRPVAEVAGSVGLSERHLRRRSLTAFGYGPKVLARILRLDRALVLARSGQPFATVADTAGYADQAHLAREVKRLAGVPLGELMR